MFQTCRSYTENIYKGTHSYVIIAMMRKWGKSMASW